MMISPPMSLLAELTHRCPLRCPYCSNPLSLEQKSSELSTEEWCRVLDEAAELGVLQVHFSGGEPMARPDLPALVRHAVSKGLYTNLITSGVLLNEKNLAELSAAGLDHVQLSFQDATPDGAELIGGLKDAQNRKLAAAQIIVADGIPLTLNFVIHRLNVMRIPQMFDLAEQLGARRVEIAHTQYYGWGLKNRGALLPSKEQLQQSERDVAAARERFGSRLAIDFVTPDYYADEPKPCMGGWGERFLNITPSGRVLPCHAAESIPNISFPNVRENSLKNIWENSEIFQLFRGTSWMPEPCRSCDRRDVDKGGCRCQALALTGRADVADPVCHRSSHRHLIDEAIAEAASHDETFIYRQMSGLPS